MGEADYERGSMDISGQRDTYAGFTKLIKWGTIFSAICAVLAVIFTIAWYDGVIPVPA